MPYGYVDNGSLDFGKYAIQIYEMLDAYKFPNKIHEFISKQDKRPYLNNIRPHIEISHTLIFWDIEKEFQLQLSF